MVLHMDKEQIKRPEDEEIEEGAETETEVVEEEEQPGTTQEADDDTGDDDTEDSEGAKTRKSPRLQRRIDELTRARHSAERERDEMVNYLRGVLDENKSLKARTFSTSEVAASEGMARAESELARAKSDLKEASELGDYDRVADIQERIADAVLDKKRLAEATARLRAEKEHAGKQESEVQIPQIAQTRPQPPDPKFQAWHQKNTWFKTDPVMTSAAYSLHMELLRAGYTGTEDEYYSQVDKRMREYFPQKFQAPKSPAQQPVAPARRAAAATQKSSAQELTESQKSIAKRLGITEEMYREGLRKLNANG